MQDQTFNKIKEAIERVVEQLKENSVDTPPRVSVKFSTNNQFHIDFPNLESNDTIRAKRWANPTPKERLVETPN